MPSLRHPTADSASHTDTNSIRTLTIRDIATHPRLQALFIRGSLFQQYIKNELQWAILNMGELEPVVFVRGRIKLSQIVSGRDSYINGIMIQSRGDLPVDGACDACKIKSIKDLYSYSNPFPTCANLPGHFGGACGNCKWADRASKCTSRGQGWFAQPVGRNQDEANQTSQPEMAGSQSNPIKIEDDDN